MSFLGSILNIGTNLFSAGISGIVEGAIEGVGQLANSVTEKLECEKDAKTKGTTLDDENSTQRKIAKEMGDIQMIALLDKEDKFIKEDQKQEEIKAKEEQEETNNQNKIEAEVKQAESQSTISLDNIVNEIGNTDIISKEALASSVDYVNDLLNDTKTNTGAAETMKTFNSKMAEIDEAINKYRNEIKEDEDGENQFSIETANDKYIANNPIETNTNNNKEDKKQYTFVA